MHSCLSILRTFQTFFSVISCTDSITDAFLSVPLSCLTCNSIPFACRCFWEPAESFLKQPGVLATTVGYTGCVKQNKPPPTYDTVCFGNDYVEAVRVAYDDEILTYRDLLDIFFDLQKPGYKRQYASVIFVDDDSIVGDDSSGCDAGVSKSQEQIAMQWKENAIQTKICRPRDKLRYETVQVEPLTSFYRAEEYHQKYWEKLRLRALVGILLIAGSSGAFNEIFSVSVDTLLLGGASLETLCNGAFLVGAAWMILERLMARDVRELDKGVLAAAVHQGHR